MKSKLNWRHLADTWCNNNIIISCVKLTMQHRFGIIMTSSLRHLSAAGIDTFSDKKVFINGRHNTYQGQVMCPISGLLKFCLKKFDPMSIQSAFPWSQILITGSHHICKEWRMNTHICTYGNFLNRVAVHVHGHTLYMCIFLLRKNRAWNFDTMWTLCAQWHKFTPLIWLACHAEVLNRNDLSSQTTFSI